MRSKLKRLQWRLHELYFNFCNITCCYETWNNYHRFLKCVRFVVFDQIYLNEINRPFFVGQIDHWIAFTGIYYDVNVNVVQKETIIEFKKKFFLLSRIFRFLESQKSWFLNSFDRMSHKNWFVRSGKIWSGKVTKINHLTYHLNRCRYVEISIIFQLN